jgi:hypothetical protein
MSRTPDANARGTSPAVATPAVTAVAPVTGDLSWAERIALRHSRRGFVFRVGAGMVSLLAGSTALRWAFPAAAQAFTDCNCGAGCCKCCCGTNCRTTNCYHRYVCGCSQAAMYHCPSGTTIRTDANGATEYAPHASQIDLQIDPPYENGRYWVFSYALNDRAWVDNSCLTTYAC